MRSQGEKPACKDLGRNGQTRIITLKATYTLVSKWPCSRSITRSQGQKPACKDLSRNGQTRAITPEATYTPVSKRPCSRSLYKEVLVMKHAKSGMTVLCQANGNMEYDFIGRIEKCYENSALVTILDYDPRDKFNVQDLVGRTVIAFKRMKQSNRDRLESDFDQPMQRDVG